MKKPPIQKKQRARFAGYLFTWQRDRYIKRLYYVRVLDSEGVLRCTTTVESEPDSIAMKRVINRLQNKG